MGVSNGYDIGVNGRDLILKTSGKIYVKVADKFYELDFRNEKTKTDTTESSEITQSDVVLLDTLTKENYPGDNKLVINNDELYITKGGFYKKVNDSTASQQTDAVEFNDSSSDNLFVKVSDNVWSLGDVSAGSEIEFLQDPKFIWNNYWFFNASKEYFFDDVYGQIDYNTFWENVFFDTTDEDPANWITKSKSEIEKTVLSEIYKDGAQVVITDFKSLYESFWYSESEFNTTIANYKGPYAEITINQWGKSFRPKSEISIVGCSALITGVIGDTVIVKFKDDNVTLDSSNIQQTGGSIAIYKNDDTSFIDIVNSDLNVYNSASQDPSNIRVRLGDLSTLNGHSGIGAAFNQNVSIKNGPFNLNSDGSGNIGSELSWDSAGRLYGSLMNRIIMLEEECQQLRDEIDYLHNSASLF